MSANSRWISDHEYRRFERRADLKPGTLLEVCKGGEYLCNFERHLPTAEFSRLECAVREDSREDAHERLERERSTRNVWMWEHEEIDRRY